MSDMRKWEDHISQQIRKAQEEGKLSNLPGEGKPLNLEEDPHTPEEMRLAYKILKENDLAPDWMMAGKVLEQKQAQLSEKIAQAVRVYRGLADKPANAEASLQAARAKLAHLAAAYNREIRDYNLKIPAGIPQRLYFDLEQEINRALKG